MDKQLKDNIINDYKSGVKVTKISQNRNIPVPTIYSVLKGNIEKKFTFHDFSITDKQNICSLYKNGMSTVKIGQRYGVYHKVIAKVLDEFGIERTGVGKRKYRLNETYFDAIDTPDKAYILGFLYADGCNSINKGTITIALQEEDREILEKMRLKIGSEKPLKFLDKSNKHDFGYTYKNQYALIMFSSYMCNTLAEKGVVPNKSLVTTFPEWLDKKLIPHFVRGVFDGDGSIYRYYKNENNQAITITITATSQFCETLKNICKDELNINAGIYDASCHNGITKVFTLSGRRIAKEFLDWIYEDADLYLQRKYDRYCDYYNINNSLSA